MKKLLILLVAGLLSLPAMAGEQTRQFHEYVPGQGYRFGTETRGAAGSYTRHYLDGQMTHGWRQRSMEERMDFGKPRTWNYENRQRRYGDISERYDRY